MAASTLSSLVAFHAGDPVSSQLAQHYVARRGPRAVLCPLPLTCGPDQESIKLSQFKAQIQAPIYAAERTRFVVVMRGVPWRVWTDSWGYVGSVDSNLTLSPAEGGGTLSAKGSPFLLDPRRIRAHQTFRFVSRIDGATSEDCFHLIDAAVEAEQAGWLSSTAYYHDTFAAEQNWLADRGWALVNGALPAGLVPSLVRWYVGSPANDPLAAAALPAVWCGWSTQSTGSLNMRSVSYWCPYMVRKGAAGTIGAVAEPYLSGFPGGHHILNAFLQLRFTWAEACWLAIPFLNHRVAPIGDPTWRMPRPKWEK